MGTSSSKKKITLKFLSLNLKSIFKNVSIFFLDKLFILMAIEELKFNEKIIEVEEREEFSSDYKIKSYIDKISFITKKEVPLKAISEVLNHLFSENKDISKKTKNSITKIMYSKKDRIISLMIKDGQEIIWNRDKLLNLYGWFFFVEKPKKSIKKSTPKKQKKKEERTVNSSEYHFEEIIISLKEKENMRALYRAKEYFHYLKIIHSNNILQMPIEQVLEDFFNSNQKIPLKEKKSIAKVIYYQKERVIVIKSLIGDQMYENLEQMVKKYGWYLYITGVPVGKSEISLAIDKIEKKYDQNYFKSVYLTGEEKHNNIRITVYPIVLKPNHNCHILGLGNLNILLDCGISEREIIEKNNDNKDSGENIDNSGEKKFEFRKPDDFEYIENYLKTLPSMILEAEQKLLEENSKGSNELEELIDETNRFSHKKADDLNIDYSPKIDAIYVSHSHYDHVSGLKRLIELYPEVPILCSRITLDLFLLRDSKFLKQESFDEIEEIEYQKIVQNVIYVENGDKVEFKDKDCFLSFFHGGHMPGALMMVAKIRDYRFLYTGDYTYYDITPFAGTKRFLEQISRPIDYLLIDGTSATEEFVNISDQFHTLILFLEQKAEYQDNVLIGADPSSLAISFMLIFWRYFRKLQLKRGYTKRPNIYVDMMVRKNIQVINHRYEYIHGPISKLIRDKANPFNSIKFRWFDLRDLDFLKDKNNIIISHPPDLSYGIIRNIINIVGRNPHNLVYLAGSIHDSPGLDLVEGSQEICFSDTWKVPFRAFLINNFFPQLKIKLHADKKQLAEMIKILEPKEVCFFHQSAKNLIDVVEYVKGLGVEKVSLPQKRKLIILN
jgi:Cft2 family RNA processing exonuclease